MFTKRIIPCLDVKNGRVVKGVNFVDLKDAGDPVAIAKAYDEAGADGARLAAVDPDAGRGYGLNDCTHISSLLP